MKMFIHNLVYHWRDTIHMERLLFLMDTARAATVLIWLVVLGLGWFEAGQYIKAIEPLQIMAQAPWPAEKLGLLDEQIKQLAAEVRLDQTRMATVAEILANLDKRVTIIDERQQGVLHRLDKSEMFWQSLQEKFLWAVVAQIGVLVIWFFLGHDLKRRMHTQNEEFYHRMNTRFPNEPALDEEED